MEIRFTVDVKGGQPASSELVSEMLTRGAPPLAMESMVGITRIREDCLAALQGSNRYAAEMVFEALESVPPIENARIRSLLNLVADSECSSEDVRSALDELKNIRTGVQADDTGFASFPNLAVDPRTGELTSCGKVYVDIVGALREALMTFLEMCHHLSLIQDPETRKEVVVACCKMIGLRFHFEVSQQGEGQR